jgi:hypothetical protein
MPWVKTWTSQPWPVMLVVGTFASDEDDLRRRGARDRLEFEDVRWMEISSLLQAAGEGVKEIEFVGERLDMTSVLRMRRRAIEGV